MRAQILSVTAPISQAFLGESQVRSGNLIVSNIEGEFLTRDLSLHSDFARPNSLNSRESIRRNFKVPISIGARNLG